jgi:hypothetical protein
MALSVCWREMQEEESPEKIKNRRKRFRLSPPVNLLARALGDGS